MTIDKYKNSIVTGLQQTNLTMLIGELATALANNEEQAAMLTKLRAELAELKKPIAGPVPEAKKPDGT